MYLRLLHIIIAISVLCFLPLDAEGKSKDIPSVFLETRVAKNKVMEGERLIYEVVLFTDNPNIAGVELIDSPHFGNIPAMRSAADSGFSSVKRFGKDYYTIVIDRYFAGFNEKGSFDIEGGDYRVAFSYPVTVNDPFWGQVVRSRMEVADLVNPDVKVKVSPLPVKGRPVDFSGAVGEFQIQGVLPISPVRAGEDAVLIVSVSGDGDLTDSDVPRMMEAFPEGLQFKSMSENRTHYIKNGSLGSEMEIEVVFHPKKEGTYTIDNIRYNFFNTKSGKYDTTFAPKIIIEVEDGTPGRGRPSEKHNI